MLIGDIARGILELGSTLGELVGIDFTDNDPGIDAYIYAAFGNLKNICNLLDLSLCSLIVKKMSLNAAKYPVERSKQNISVDEREIGKYSSYDNQLKCSKNNVIFTNNTINSFGAQSEDNQDVDWKDNVEQLANTIEIFARERNWLSYYTMEKVGISLLSELGELAEVIEWHDHYDDASTNVPLLNKLAIEIADISIYLFHLSRLADFDFNAYYSDISDEGISMQRLFSSKMSDDTTD